MIQVQRKLGKETFPLVNQSYYPNHFELVRGINKCMIFNQLKIAFSVESSFLAEKAFSIFCSISYFQFNSCNKKAFCVHPCAIVCKILSLSEEMH